MGGNEPGDEYGHNQHAHPCTDLDEASHGSPLLLEPSGYGGQHDYIHTTQAHTSNEPIKQIQLPDSMNAAHE